MSQRHHSKRLLVAAIATLLTGNLAGASGLVLCLTADGHRAVEIEHLSTACPTLANSETTTGISGRAPAACVDLPAAGAGPIAHSSLDAERVSLPPMAFLAVALEPAPHIAVRLPASADARAGPPTLPPHLTSTVLLV